MDPREELAALRRMAELEAKANQAPTLRGPDGAPLNYKGPSGPKQFMEALPAVPIAAGRGVDRVISGLQQANTAGEVIKAELLGRDSSGYTANLGALERDQAEKARLYAPLAKEFPLATGVGEALPLAATPMGQATAFGRVMAPTVAAAAYEGAKYGDPKERALGAARSGVAALGGGATSEVIRRFIQPLPGVAGTAAQTQIKEAANKIPGFQPLPDQIAGSPELKGITDMLAQSPGGRGPIASRVAANSAAINRHYLKGVGVQADYATPEVLDQAHTQIVAARAQLAPNVRLDATQSAFDAVDRAEKILLKGADAGKQEALDTVRKLKDQLYSSKSISGPDWDVWQSDIGAISRSTQNDKVAGVLRTLRNELNDQARGPAASEWKKLDKQYAQLETLYRPNVIDAEGNIRPQAIHRILSSDMGKVYQRGKLDSESADVAALGAVLRNPREGSQTFARGESDSLMGLAKALVKYPAAKALTSEGFSDYLTKGLLASPEASRRAAALLSPGVVPLVAGPIDLGLLGYLRGQ